MRLAIIDMGTNTFNLLMVEVFENKTFNIIYEDKVPVKLGKGGINNQIIQPDAFQRGLETIDQFKEIIGKNGIKLIYAYGTSALRNASNSSDFIYRVKDKFNINIQVINGNDEAKYIYKGVQLATCLDERKSLIMDIGGGSTEFIICNKNQIFWINSFELGTARILELLNPSDPMIKEEIIDFENFLSQELNILFFEMKKHKVEIVLGASGAFETIVALLNAKIKDKINDLKYRIPVLNFKDLSKTLIKSTLAERLVMPGMPAFRAEYMVLAVIFINFIIDKFLINEMIYSKYALKEGVLADVISGKFNFEKL